MSWASIGAAVAGAAVSAAGSAAIAKATTPDSPDLASSSREMSNTNAALLPIRRALEAAAKQGGKVTVQNYPAHREERGYYTVEVGSDWGTTSENIQDALRPDPTGTGIVTSLGLFGKKKTKRYDTVPASEFEPGGKYAGRTPPDTYHVQMTDIPEGPKTFDFTGFGEADANAAVAQQMAKVQLDLGAKYGEDFAKVAADQAKLADPLGYQARQKMDELIQGQINRTPDRSIANALDRQIQGQLDAGSGLDAETQAMLDDAVRRAGNDRGGVDAGANFADPLTTGYQGAARKDAAMQKGLSWLTSGATPQDAAYRDTQQNMSNLSALVNGRTPQSQFASLSAPGAAPQAQVQGGAQISGNSAAQGAAGALNSYGAQVQAAQNQVSPWMMGLSGLLSAANASAANKKTV